MTDQDTPDRQERVVDVQPPLATHPQAAELVQPADRAFHRPADLAQPAAVSGVSSGDVRRGADLTQRLPVGLRVIGAVGVQRVEV